MSEDEIERVLKTLTQFRRDLRNGKIELTSATIGFHAVPLDTSTTFLTAANIPTTITLEIEWQPKTPKGLQLGRFWKTI